MRDDQSSMQQERSESLERELVRRLTSYIDASSLSNTDHWRMSKLRREAVSYLEVHGGRTLSETRTTEPTEAMCDAPRQFIAYCETPGRTFEGARQHLVNCGVDYEETWPAWALIERGHITKSAVAAITWHMMEANRG